MTLSGLDSIDVSKLTLKVMGTGPRKTAVASIDNSQVVWNMCTEGTWLESLWGFDFTGKYEAPSFITGIAPTPIGKTESLSLKVSTGFQTELLRSLDVALEGKLAEQQPGFKWNPLVDADGRVKFQVALSGAPHTLTVIRVVKDGVIHKGTGFQFLQSFGVDFSRTQIKAAVRLKKVWMMSGKAGATLVATQLVLKFPEGGAEADPFADDDLMA